MKKLSVFLSIVLAIVMVAVLFTSCEEQPGVYKPKKKISKVYQQEAGEVEYLKEEWIWDGSKVSSISYYYEGELQVKEEYIYEGNRVSQIRDDRGYYFEYYYEDRQFGKIKFYDPATILLAEVTFQYNGKQISMFTIHVYEWEKNLMDIIGRGFVGKLLSKEGMKMIATKLVNQSKKTIGVNLTYAGDNLASVELENETITYSDYDTHSNIWYNFFPFTDDESFNLHVFSKNNPGKVIDEFEISSTTTRYVYTYDGEFPVIIQSNEVYENDHGVEYDASRIRIEYE